MRGVLLVVVLGSTACLQSTSIICGEKTCPETWVCTPSGTSCVPRGAADACNGIDPDGACEVDEITGTCIDGVCEVIICGNGRLDPTEVCDDGNIDANDGCNPTCRSNETCGNGVIDPGEGCDCGAGSVLNSACTMENTEAANAECRTNCTLPGCGDGIVTGAEQCEPGVAVTASCEQFGFYEGTVGCSSICQFEPSGCTKSCGDGVVNGTGPTHPESCDGDPPKESCLDYGFDAGQMACTSICTPSTANCRSIGWRSFASDTTEFLTVWGTSATDVTVTGKVHSQRWNGAQWFESQMPTLPSGRFVESTWTTSTGVQYGVGADRVLRYDGALTEFTIPGGNDLHAIHGSSPSFIIAVGNAGTITYWNGTSWQPMASGTTSRLNNVLVLSSTDAYVVGDDSTVLRYNGTSWAPMPAPPSLSYRAVWGTSASNIYIGGDGGLLRYNGSIWSSIPLSVRAQIKSIHGSGPNDVWVSFGSSDRTVAHFDGTSWSFSDPGTLSVFDIWSAGGGSVFGAGITPTRYLGSTWATQSHNIRPIMRAVGGTFGAPIAVGDNGMAMRLSGGMWRTISGDIAVNLNGVSKNVVVGDRGTLAVFDGTRLVRKQTNTTQDLIGVWASSDTDAWAVGYGGVIVHYTGSSASVVASGTTQHLNGICGFSTSDIYAVGDAGTMLHYNGSSWSAFNSNSAAPLRAIAGTSTNDFWVAGGNATVRHYVNGVGSDAGSVPNGSFAGIFVGNNEVVVTQANGAPQKYNISANTWQSEFATQQLVFLGSSSFNEVYGIGNNLSLERRVNSSWREELPSYVSFATTGTSIYAISPTDIYMTTNVGPLLHFDGYIWSRVSTSVAFGNPLVVGGAGSAVFAYFSSSAEIAVWNGTSWQTTDPAASYEFRDFAGVSATDAWGVGMLGQIRHWNGTDWSTTAFAATPPTATLNGIYVAPDGTAFAVGTSGTALRWNGTSWVATATNTTAHLEDVWGRSSTDVYAVGASGTILHWDGSTWTKMTTTGIGSSLTGLTGPTTGPTEVFAYGNGGTLVRYDGTQWLPVRSPTANGLTDGAYVGGALYMTTSSLGIPYVQLERDVTW